MVTMSSRLKLASLSSSCTSKQGFKWEMKITSTLLSACLRKWAASWVSYWAIQFSIWRNSSFQHLINMFFETAHFQFVPYYVQGTVPGNALVVDPKKQFRPLSKFGNAFLNRFMCSNVNSEVLKGFSIIDTPGVLSGEKQRTNRGYDF